MEFVDTHCHIHFADYKLDPDAVLAEARAAGVTKVICVGTTLEDSQSAIDFAASHPGVWASAGIHPYGAKDFVSDNSARKKLAELLRQPKVVAVGEIGLDYYRTHSRPDEQKEALKDQIEIGLAAGLPFIFHIRDALPAGRQAWEDFWPIFDSYKGLRGVVHSFSTGEVQLRQILERDLAVGLNGIMTFTGDSNQLDAAKKIPPDRLLLETDAPFLTPAPYRGQVCQPKHVRNVAEFLAELRVESLEGLAAASTKNAVELFKLSK